MEWESKRTIRNKNPPWTCVKLVHCHRLPLWRKYPLEVKATKGLNRCRAKVKGVNNPTWIAQYLKSLEENAECWDYHMQYHWTHNVHKQTDFIPHSRYQCYLRGDDAQDNCQFVECSKHLWDCHHHLHHHCHPEVTLFDGMWKSKRYLVIIEISFSSKCKLFSLFSFFFFFSFDWL